VKTMNRLSKKGIIASLPSELIRWEVHYLPETESTQNAAAEIFRKTGRGGILVATNFQKTGRGREGRSWISPKGQALLFSFVLLPGQKEAEIYFVTITTALAVCDALRRHLGLFPEVKWPNDVLLNGKKVCGILTELTKTHRGETGIIVGVGLNVNQRTPAFSGIKGEPATSLLIETNRIVPRLPLLGAVMRSFEDCYFLYQKGRKDEIVRRWKRDSCMVGQRVRLCAGNREVEGMVVDLADSGALVLRLDNGHTESFFGSACRLV